jgi:hypothetical protein
MNLPAATRAAEDMPETRRVNGRFGNPPHTGASFNAEMPEWETMFSGNEMILH